MQSYECVVIATSRPAWLSEPEWLRRAGVPAPGAFNHRESLFVLSIIKSLAAGVPAVPRSLFSWELAFAYSVRTCY